ncbi:MAG: putative membrane protein YdjX (TVP38/TMEM64 family) [Myxococcota bacterium]|jgi:uncharacterized membrane protein YdjX (TVP38/TMEM64 family)
MTHAAVRWALVGGAVLAFVLVPFALVGEPLEAWMTDLLHQARQPSAVFASVVGLLVVDVFVPVPSSMVATVGGYELGWLGGTLAAWLGLTAGHAVGYATGRALGAGGLTRFVGPDEVIRARTWLDLNGLVGLALTRPVPVLSEATVLLAGALRADPVRIIGVCVLADLGVAAVYAGAGALSADTGVFALAVGSSVVLPAVAAAAAAALSRQD